MRCYEALGGRATATLRFGFPVRSAAVTDLLERTLTDVAVDDDNSVRRAAAAVRSSDAQVVAYRRLLVPISLRRKGPPTIG